MGKTLLAITTFNQIKYTEFCRASIPEINDLDVIFIDDQSTDNTVLHLKSKGVNVIEKAKGAGLTDSWNTAYRIFKEKEYNALIISNNDVIFNQSLENMVNALQIHAFVLPMTGKGKSSCTRERQEVKTYHRDFNDTNPTVVKDNINHIYKDIRYVPIDWWNGFCFGLNRKIINLELDEKHLFDPKNTNTHQEEGFYRTLQKHNISPHVCTGTYVYHFYQTTLPYLGEIDGKDSRQLLEFNRERNK